jgi:hypothetical protein
MKTAEAINAIAETIMFNPELEFLTQYESPPKLFVAFPTTNDVPAPHDEQPPVAAVTEQFKALAPVAEFE